MSRQRVFDLLLALGLISILLSSLGCTGAEGNQVRTDPHGCVQTGVPESESSQVGPYTLLLSKTTAKTGDQIDLKIDGENADMVGRGIDSLLECWDGTRWVPIYILLTSYGANEPRYEPYSADLSIVDLGLSGPGPEIVRLPKVPSGRYRLTKRVSVRVNDVLETYVLHAPLAVEE